MYTGPVHAGELRELGIPGGVRVADLRAGKSADTAGLTVGDIIMRLGGHVVRAEKGRTQVALRETLKRFDPGETVPVEIVRDGERRTVQVLLGGYGRMEMPRDVFASAKAALPALRAEAGDKPDSGSSFRVYLLQAGPIQGDFAPTEMTVTFDRRVLHTTPFVFEDIPLPRNIMDGR